MSTEQSVILRIVADQYGVKKLRVGDKLHASTAYEGLDWINAKLLKEAAPIVAGPLSYIFNMSLKHSIIPTEWKKARVSPIFITGNIHDPSYYRPISVLPICMKIFEKLVHEQLYNYMSSNDLLCNQQSGFRPNHSTVTTLLNRCCRFYT